eukprot:3683414-Amphidinium_carterae.1
MQLPIRQSTSATTTDITLAAHHVATTPMYPTAQASTVERRRLDNVRYQCAACKRHMEMTHPMHSREASGPRSCRYPHVEAVDRRCPACRACLPMTDERHTLEA